MALDRLDLGIILAIVIIVSVYFLRPYLVAEKKDEGGFLNSNLTSDRDIASYIKSKNKDTVIFYGSQTGTAEDYAHKLSKELSSRFGLHSMTADLSNFDFDKIDSVPDTTLFFFLLATYGEGEPTDNAVEFVEWLLNDADTLSNLKYSVFGLGNSTYEFFNKIGKDIDTLLEDKGANRFAPYSHGDDGNGTLDEDFLEWKDSVFDSLKNDLNLNERELVYTPSLKLIEMDLDFNDLSVSHGEPDKSYIDSKAENDGKNLGSGVGPVGEKSSLSPLSKGPFNHNHPYLAPITFTKELFTSSSRNCIQAAFDISNSNLRYSTGDHLAIWPSNALEYVDLFLKTFNLESKSNSVFNLKTLDSTVTIPFPTPITYSAVIKHHLEITGPISRQFLLSIIAFAPNSNAKTLVTKLAGDKIQFAKEITSKKLNIADALLYISNGEPWSKVPFEFIIENIPHLQSRYYSISSSSLQDKTTIEVTAVVESEIQDDRKITGVVTNLLNNIEINQNKNSNKTPLVNYNLNGPRNKFSNFKLPVHVRRSTFKLPTNPSTPVIMIGPGTGVAPFRGFIRDRIHQKDNGKSIGESILFYGCRNSNEDFLYKNEWPEYSKKLGDKFELFTAFSRESEKKVYVQNILQDQSSKINELIEAGAFIYVCGDASRMAREVQATLAKIISTERNIDLEKGVELIRSFKVQNRYQEDVW